MIWDFWGLLSEDQTPTDISVFLSHYQSICFFQSRFHLLSFSILAQVCLKTIPLFLFSFFFCHMAVYVLCFIFCAQLSAVLICMCLAVCPKAANSLVNRHIFLLFSFCFSPPYVFLSQGSDWVLPSSSLKLSKLNAMDEGQYTCSARHPSVESLNKRRTISITVLPGKKRFTWVRPFVLCTDFSTFPLSEN